MPTLNKKHINELIETLRPLRTGHDEGEFDMTNWQHKGHACGTPSCMAGWATWIVEGRPTGPLEHLHSECEDAAAQYLGLTYEQADELFLPFDAETAEGYDTNNIQPHHAIAVLEHLRDTGKVDWSFAGLPMLEDYDDEIAYYELDD